MKQPENSISSSLWQVSILWQRGVKKALDTIDITLPQSVILSSLLFLSKQKGPVTQIDLSLHSKIDPMTTSTIIRILEKKQLVKRQEHGTDTRAKVVVLTASGTKITKQVARIIERFDQQFFKNLGPKAKVFHTALATLLKARQE